MHSDTHVYDQLTRAFREVNDQIDHVRVVAINQGIKPERMQDKDGNFVMTSLLLAKSNCLNGMAVLKAAQKKGK